jgi:hypothetical protein
MRSCAGLPSVAARVGALLRLSKLAEAERKLSEAPAQSEAGEKKHADALAVSVAAWVAAKAEHTER